MGIVENARAEQAATSGAMHGGATASFLKADDTNDGPSGDELIDSLVNAKPAEPSVGDRPAAVEGEPATDEPSPADEVLSSLMEDDTPSPDADPAQGAAAPGGGGTDEPARPVVQSDVDDDVIGSLLDGRGGDGEEDAKR